MERGKPVALPARESEPQGEPIGLRVWDRGASEGRPVTGRIGVEHVSEITPRESGLTSAGFLITRESGKATKEARQMTGERVRGGRASVHPGPLSGAASHGEDGWDRIDWHQVNQDVRRLQVRIVKATKEGRWGRVKALQRLLTHSFSGKALAVRRVTGNRGRRTPGIDRETWSTPAQKWTAVHQLRQHGYRPRPLRRVYIPKRDSSAMRPLGIPVMKDRAMQALYLQALVPIAETTGDESSYGFRTGRSAADAIEQCFTVLARRTSAEWILEGDIASCFDRISHDWLLNHVPMERSILHKWLKAGFMDKTVFFPTESGTPQGGIASPVLANMALDGLQKAIRERFPRWHDGRNRKVNMVRYADDFIVTGDSKQLLEDEVMPLVERFLGERGLELSRKKTVVTHIEAGFDFLGQTVRKYRGKLLVTPSKQRTRSFLGLVRERIKANRAASAGELVRMLNPALRGWANYHRHVVSKDTFRFVDHQIWKALWQWALRRHPKKGSQWVRSKYFTAHKGRQWIFTGQVKTAAGEKRELRLFSVASVLIWRHVLVKSAANPFDPDWDAYFANRRLRRLRKADHDRQWLDGASVTRSTFRHAQQSSTSSVLVGTPSSSGAEREA